MNNFVPIRVRGTCSVRTLGFVGLILCVYSPAAHAQGQSEPTTAVANDPEGWTAALPVRIEFDPTSLNLTVETIPSLLRRSGSAYAAVCTAFGVSPEVFPKSVTFEFTREKPTEKKNTIEAFDLEKHLQRMETSSILKYPRPPAQPSGRITGWIVVHIDEHNSDGVPKKAESFARSLCTNLQLVFRHLDKQIEQNLQLEVDDANRNFARASEDLAKLQDKKQQLGPDVFVGMTKESVFSNIENYEKTRQTLALERIGLVARRSAMEEQLSRVAKEIEIRAGKDEVIKHLERIVELRMSEMARVRALIDKGQASTNEVTAFDEQLAKAQAEVAKQRQAVMQAAGAERISRIQEELDRIIADLAGIEARFDFLNTDLQRLRSPSLMSKLKQSEALVIEQNRIEAAVSHAAARRDELLNRFRLRQRPTMTVIEEPDSQPSTDNK